MKYKKDVLKTKAFKIGVFGSAEGAVEEILEKAKELGRLLAKQNVIIITGACSGVPYAAASVAAKNGTEVWGFSPEINFENQKVAYPNNDITIYKKLTYISRRYEFVNNPLVAKKYRNVTSTATCDAGIIISGRWGTLNEFTNLFDMGKVIGVLTGTGGIAGELESLSSKIHKPGKAKIIFNSDPQKLVNEVIDALKFKSS